VQGTEYGEPIIVNTDVTLTFDNIKLEQSENVDSDLIVEVPIYYDTNKYPGNLSFSNSTALITFVDESIATKNELVEVTEFKSTVTGIGAYLALDSNGYLRLNNSAKNGNLKTLHIQGTGDYNESFHARWGYNSALKISNEYAR
jgi:hypothetical protein